MSVLFDAVYRVMSIEFTLFGFTFSYWEVYLWSIIAIIIGAMIVRFFVE